MGACSVCLNENTKFVFGEERETKKRKKGLMIWKKGEDLQSTNKKKKKKKYRLFKENALSAESLTGFETIERGYIS